MGLLQDAGGDDEPVRDAAGVDQPLWMGTCADCGALLTVLGGQGIDRPRCASCRSSAEDRD